MRLILALIVSLALCFALGAYRHYARHRVHWSNGLPYCPDGSLAGADEYAAAAGKKDVAVCE
jgi:hypothetical protein